MQRLASSAHSVPCFPAPSCPGQRGRHARSAPAEAEAQPRLLPLARRGGPAVQPAAHCAEQRRGPTPPVWHVAPRRASRARGCSRPQLLPPQGGAGRRGVVGLRLACCTVLGMAVLSRSSRAVITSSLLQGYVHGDLKSSNVLLTACGTAKLAGGHAGLASLQRRAACIAGWQVPWVRSCHGSRRIPPTPSATLAPRRHCLQPPVPAAAGGAGELR